MTDYQMFPKIFTQNQGYVFMPTKHTKNTKNTNLRTFRLFRVFRGQISYGE